MTSSRTETKKRLYGLYVIVAVQLIALMYVFYEELFVSVQPRNWFLIAAGAATTALAIGLLLRSNIARLILVFICSLNILLQSVLLVLLLIGAWGKLGAPVVIAVIFMEFLVPLVFMIAVVVYLTKEEVRSQFKLTPTEPKDSEFQS